jgi:hypothetical protein
MGEPIMSAVRLKKNKAMRLFESPTVGAPWRATTGVKRTLHHAQTREEKRAANEPRYISKSVRDPDPGR